MRTDAQRDGALKIPGLDPSCLMRRAYSYKRFSSPKQARGDSIRRQTAFEQEIVKEMDLLLDDTMDLSDTGVSAFHGKNAKFGALAEFMKVAESGRVPPGSVLIIENIDRLSRENVFDAFNLFSRIIGAGITIVTAEPRDIYDKESVQGNVAKLMVPLVYMMRAHDESKTKSYRIHKAWNQRRKRAIEEGLPLTEKCPHWLKVVGKKKYEVIESRAKVVRDIYEWAREGMGTRLILKKLVADGVKPFGRKDGWHQTYVRKLLTWPAVYGEMQPCVFKEGKKEKHGDPIPNYYPAIITKGEYNQARQTAKFRKGKDGRPSKGDGNLFTGIVWHVGDRVRMSVRTSGSAKRISYIRSTLVDKGLPAKEARQFPYQVFEEGVLNALLEMKPEDVSDLARKQTNELDEKAKDLAAELFQLRDSYDATNSQLSNPKNKIPGAQLIASLNSISAAIEQIQEQLNHVQADATNCRGETLGEAQTVISLMRATPPGPERDKYRRKIKTRLRWLLSEVWVHIEKVNHIRSFAHVQLFLRNGAKKDVIISSFTAAPGRKDVVCRRTYTDVDFRTYTATASDRSVGKGKLADVLKGR